MINVFYRISDGGYAKEKPNYVNNKKCLNNFLKNFEECKNIDLCFKNLLVIADKVSDDTYNWLNSKILNLERTGMTEKYN